MRTSALLPEECREEIKMRLADAQQKLALRYHPVTIGYIVSLAWVLGDDDHED